MDRTSLAKAIPISQRRRILMEYREPEFHEPLRALFQEMEPNYTVEVTHGAREFGKDLVIVRSDHFKKEAIAVVVKCGDIKGKTSGDVDLLSDRVKAVLSKSHGGKLKDIESQIQQAFEHPAELKSILEDLPISSVYVVLAGEFSNQARKRLSGELASKTTVFDINWLIEKFTEFYPQIFFDGRAIDFIEKKVRVLEANHRLESAGKNLSEYFVDPLVRKYSIPNEGDDDNPAALLKGQKIALSTLGKIATRARRVILLGDPGSGKTGSMAKFASQMLKDAGNLLWNKRGTHEKKIPVPVFTPLRSLLNFESWEDFQYQYFESEEVQSKFEIQLIMADGLDEIPAEQRGNAIKKLEDFTEIIGCPYIITSRRIDIIDALPQKYHKYELLPFEVKQALQFFTTLVRDDNTLRTLTNSLEEIKSRIPLLPLSLILLIELVEERKEIPRFC